MATRSIFVNSEDNVECTDCGFLKWYLPGSDIFKTHVIHKPDCDYIRSVGLKKSSRPAQFASFDSLKYESERLATFINWQNNYVSPLPEKLAENGFFFLREEDKCACIFCGGIIADWSKGGYIHEEHAKQFPQCPFVNEKPVGNVNMLQCNILNTFGEPALVPPTIERIVFADGNVEEENRRAESGTRNCGRLNRRLLNPRLYDHLNPNVRNAEYMMMTFETLNWPLKDIQNPENMVKAGFYYTGVSDHVRCGHCGLGLRNWAHYHKPMEEHVAAYPECPFVGKHKSTEEIYWSENLHRRRYGTNYYISEAWLDSLMDTNIIRELYKNGYKYDFLRRILAIKLQRTGVPFFTVDSFVKQIDYFSTSSASRKTEVFFIPCEHSDYENGTSNTLPGKCTVCLNNYEAKFFTIPETDNILAVCDECKPYKVSIQEDMTSRGKVYVYCDVCYFSKTRHGQGSPYGTKCVLCDDSVRNVIFLPCSHIQCCQTCAATVDYCPLCFSLVEKKYVQSLVPY